jgi:hypothetical protein
MIWAHLIAFDLFIGRWMYPPGHEDVALSTGGRR